MSRGTALLIVVLDAVIVVFVVGLVIGPRRIWAFFSGFAAGHTKGSEMEQTFEQLHNDVLSLKDVADAAGAVIDGIAARVASGIQAALDSGATPQALQALKGECATLEAMRDRLAAAVAANTPGGPVVALPPAEPTPDPTLAAGGSGAASDGAPPQS